MTWKFQQIEPQKARGKLVESVWDSPEWIAEEKFDGDRRVAQFCDSGLIRFTGCRASVNGGMVEKTANLPHLHNLYPELRSFRGTVLDGEMVPPHKQGSGSQSKYVTSIMGSLPERAVELQKLHGWLRYKVFDCLFFKGEDVRELPLRDRYNYRDQVIRAWQRANVMYVDLVEAVAGVGKRTYYDRVVGHGGEGVVLKHVRHRYGEANLWIKVKAKWTADVVVMGFTEGRGKYIDQIGAVIYGQYKDGKLREYGQCAGMDDDLRAELTKQKAKFIGKVMEIKHYGREPSGAFRHPQFQKFRTDKRATQCIYREEEI